MSVIKMDKDELQSVVNELKSEIKSLKTSKNSLKTSIGKANNYDGLNISGAANTLKKNLDAVIEELDTVQQNMDRYVGQVIDFDVDDFNGSTGSFEFKNAQILPPVEESGGVPVGNVVYYSSPTYSGNYSSSGGYTSSGTTYSTTGTQAAGAVKELGDSTVITLPSGIGSVHTYMGWQCITSRSSTQYKLIEAAGMNFDEEGFGKIGDRYVIACTTTYGKVGDYVDIVQEDGTIIKCIIGDIKNQNDAGCNKWGHNNGQCVVEFVVDKNTWYSGGKGSHANPGTSSCHPEWNQNITQVINRGSYFDSPAGPKDITNLDTAEPGKSVSYTVGGDTNVDISKYHNNLAAGFEVTTGNKTYNLSAEDYDLICSIVAAESDQGYDDALAVASTILNRCETSNWVAAHGTSPVAQATAPNQFVVYQHGAYKRYTNGNAPDTVKTAVMDALNGVRNHDYLSFRSNGSTGYSNNMISSTGNRYK